MIAFFADDAQKIDAKLRKTMDGLMAEARSMLSDENRTETGTVNNANEQ